MKGGHLFSGFDSITAWEHSLNFEQQVLKFINHHAGENERQFQGKAK